MFSDQQREFKIVRFVNLYFLSFFIKVKKIQSNVTCFARNKHKHQGRVKYPVVCLFSKCVQRRSSTSTMECE